MNMNFKKPHALPEKSYQDSTCIFVKLNQAFCFALLSRIALKDEQFTGVFSREFVRCFCLLGPCLCIVPKT